MNQLAGYIVKSLALVFALLMLGGFVWFRQNGVKKAMEASRADTVESRVAPSLPEQTASEKGVYWPMGASSSKSGPVFPTTPVRPDMFSTSKSGIVLESTDLAGGETVPITIMPGTKSMVMPVFQTRSENAPFHAKDGSDPFAPPEDSEPSYFIDDPFGISGETIDALIWEAAHGDVGKARTKEERWMDSVIDEVSR